jgi:DUF1009 family protein
VHQKNENLPPLGIVAGRGLLPVELANLYTIHGGLCHIACIDPDVNELIVKNFSHKFFKLGEVGAIIDFFKSHNITELTIAGKIDRPNLKTIKVDLTGALLIAKIFKQKFLGDDKLLKIVAEFLETKDFKIISAESILSKNTPVDEFSTIEMPTDQDLIDIELGVRVAQNLGILDIGQAVVVENGYVLGVEAAEGTDNLIERCALLRKNPNGGVLVKIMKPNQDDRLDIPSIGVETIQKLINYNYNGIAIENNKVIIIDSTNAYKLANSSKIFIKKV